MGQGQVTLSSLEVFVLDEADRMLDMGFVHDVKRIIAVLPKQRQSLFFSATMPSEIRSLASTILTTPVEVAVTPVSSTAEKIAQNLYFVEKHDKRALLLHLLQDRSIARALVFTRTKHGANRVAESLEKARVASAAIHGNKSQGARERALSGFKTGALRVLVATDIAARGIDVEGVTHVFNFDLPNIPESYVHRIGRTARAGAEGIAISFCEQEERPFLVDIERLIQMNIPRVDDHPFRSSMSAPQPTDLQPRAGRRGPVTAPPPRSQASQGQRPRAQGGHGAHERPRPSQSQSQSQSQGHGPSHANPSSQAHAPSQANAPRPARSTPNAPTNAPTHTAETVHSGRLERRKRSWV
jgi:ATP-dependent RNA helicase RhlE